MSAIARVILADDHTLVREALVRLLSDHAELEVVGQAADGMQAVDLATRLRPDLLILDFSMPHFDGPAVIEQLVKSRPELKILVLTVHDNIHYVVKVLEAGAHGYVAKSAAAEELFKAIRTVREGDIYVSPRVSKQVMQQLRRPRRHRTGLDALSPREFDLLRLLATGMGLQEASRHLEISTSAASTYRSRLMEKLQLLNTAELIRFSIENDIVG